MPPRALVVAGEDYCGCEALAINAARSPEIDIERKTLTFEPPVLPYGPA